ncbi:MAG TPA: ERF family protein [Syntrophales bacterium]|nr:ERF family protein [Syntrophales bacterium]
MSQSETIGKLADALAKAQGIMEGAVKDSQNPFFKSSYADLASVWDACRKPLANNGLSVVQTADFLPEHPEMVCIDTTLCHSSGEWMRGRLVARPVKSDPQAIGSCITYLRRYSLQSIVGIAPEDDDGNAASAGVGDNKTTKPPAEKTALAGNEETKTVYIKSVEEKPGVSTAGANKGKPYVKYGITDEDGNIYQTFKKDLSLIASGAAANIVPVKVAFVKGQYGNNLVSITIVEPQDVPDNIGGQP